MRKPGLLFLLFLCLAGIGFVGARMLDAWRRVPITPTAGVRHIESGTKAPKPAARQVHGLLRVDDSSLVVDLRYATTNNFTGKCLYRQACLVLNAHTAEKLLAASAEFQTLGYRLKIWDAYRPLSVQRVLWRKYPHGGFVADPYHGSTHNRGAAVDVTLVDAQGTEILMPSAFDEFSPRAASDYRGGPPEAIRHRELLARVMLKHGFRGIQHEWWHFEDRNALAYPVQDVPFTQF